MGKRPEIKDSLESIGTDEIEFPPELLQKVAAAPTRPGIYQYFNKSGKIIYVGKAKNLRNRVRSYFQKGRPQDAKTRAMIGKIADVDYIVVDNEAEALILEDTLIKKHKPRYNILLRDDKSYPFIRVTKEEYPRIFATRNVIRDGSKYFGPFTDVRHMKQLLKTIRSIFRFRTCDYNINEETIEKGKYKICLDYHIDKCGGPCEGLSPKEKYQENVRHAIRIINGKTKDLQRELEEKMNQFAEEMRFEEAAVMRNKLALLREYSEKQKIVSAEAIDRDIFAIARVDENACAIALKVRDGKLTGKRHFIIKNAEIDDDATILQRTLEKWYLENDFVPREIFLPDEPEDLEYLLGWLAGKRGGPVNIKIPRIGEKRHMVEMAETNARFILKERQIAIDRREQSLPHAVTALQRDLRLPNPPRRIECIDNSHIQGSDMVSSLVVFEEGKPKKADYRKFKIKSVEKGDDFAAMREVVNRRYSRLIAEEQPLPDLIVIDGGKGQLSAAYGVLKELAIEGKVPVVGLAKRLEEVFFPGEKEPYLLPRTSSSLRLIQQLRDEAHRFAIAFHRQLRDKRTLRTELTNIPGIGEKTAQKLLINLNSVEEIRNAGLEKLREFVNLKQAEAIRKYFDQASGENFEVID